MSQMYKYILEWYRDGMWSKKRVTDAYERGKITKEEYDTLLSIKD